MGVPDSLPSFSLEIVLVKIDPGVDSHFVDPKFPRMQNGCGRSGNLEKAGAWILRQECIDKLGPPRGFTDWIAQYQDAAPFFGKRDVPVFVPKVLNLGLREGGVCQRKIAVFSHGIESTRVGKGAKRWRTAICQRIVVEFDLFRRLRCHKVPQETKK